MGIFGDSKTQFDTLVEKVMVVVVTWMVLLLDTKKSHIKITFKKIQMMLDDFKSL